MRRYGIVILLLFFIMFGAAWLALAAPTQVSTTKHNLSSSGPGTIKSVTVGGTSEVCVFCHTPHSAKTDAPLWNRNMSNNSYTLYTSDVLSQLGGGTYPGAESPSTGAPHVKTRICLSCHDGTVALGQLVNLPYGLSSDIPMLGTGANYKMPQTATGYIGIELQDDHPVAIKYVSGSGSGQDPELRGIITGNKIWLYDSSAAKTQNTAGTGYMECTSCHNPHDNQNGNFLVDSNRNSAICTSCHAKTGYEPTSIHASSGTLYAPTNGAGGSLGTAVGAPDGVKCMDCHFPHKSGVESVTPAQPNPSYGKYLLSFKEEQSCFNYNVATGQTDRWGTAFSTNPCHGNGPTAAAKNIQSEVIKSSGHKVGDYTGKHEATDGRDPVTGQALYNWINNGGSLAKWHVECTDCHNAHTAGNVSHTPPLVSLTTITASSSLYGAGGVGAAWGGTSWQVPSSYTYREPQGVLTINLSSVQYEYEICFKCHSDYAWGLSPPTGPIGYAMTNQAKEFNPNNTITNNASSHPVTIANPNTNGTYVLPWTNDSQIMYCSDCHNGGAASPQGPHGSNATVGSGVAAAILAANFVDTYPTSNNPAQNQPSSDLCFNCHSPSVYNTSLGGDTTPGTGFMTNEATPVNLHNRHKTVATNPVSTRAYRCVNCHTRIPHGWKRKALVVLQNDGGAGEYYEANGPGSGLILSTSPNPLPPSGTYAGATTGGKNANCTTVPGCH